MAMRYNVPIPRLDGLTEAQRNRALTDYMRENNRQIGMILQGLYADAAKRENAVGEAMKTAKSAATPEQVEEAVARSEAREADYVVETGSDGNWTWKKWASGEAECWRDSNHTIAVNGLTAMGAVYMIEESRSYPTGLFIEAPQLWPTAGHTGGSTKYPFWVGINKNQTTSTANYAIFRHEQQAARATFYVNLYAKGRWKQED